MVDSQGVEFPRTRVAARPAAALSWAASLSGRTVLTMLERLRDDDEPFATATWRHLGIFTYELPPDLLRPLVPQGLELDTREGSAFASLVAFDFRDVKVWGVGWPGFRRFPEVNLRFYVRHGERRGVVFVREFVPQPFVAWMAGLLFHEPYEATPVESAIEERDGELSVHFEWSHRGTIHSVSLETEATAGAPDGSSDARHFNSPRWGFGTDAEGRTVAYEVRHPDWHTYPVVDYEMDVDWEHLYGTPWGALSERSPISVQLAEGSTVEIHEHQPLASLDESSTAPTK